MVILVPVESENTDGYRRREHIVDMVDEVGAEKKKLETPSRPQSRVRNGRRGESVDSNYDGGFGLKKKAERPYNTLPSRRRGDDENQLYAEYLRTSSSAGSIRRD
jgi:hypothetical protein